MSVDEFVLVNTAVTQEDPKEWVLRSRENFRAARVLLDAQPAINHGAANRSYYSLYQGVVANLIKAKVPAKEFADQKPWGHEYVMKRAVDVATSRSAGEDLQELLIRLKGRRESADYSISRIKPSEVEKDFDALQEILKPSLGSPLWNV